MPDLQHPVFQAQDAALSLLFTCPILSQAKLCGGTALARAYLGHRVSYDLDFFLPSPFDPIAFGVQMKQAGLKATALDIVEDPHRANQWHGFVSVNGQKVKVSAVEDAYYDVYPRVEATIGALTVPTEPIEGLYHRKLLTVSHSGGEEGVATGGRQTARDLFDLWVLSQEVAPIRAFMETLPYDYPFPAFEDGIYSMPWFGLVQEFSELAAAPRWKQGQDIGVVREHLFKEIGFVAEEQNDLDEPDAPKKGLRP